MTFTTNTPTNQESPATRQRPGDMAHKDTDLMSTQHRTDHLDDDHLRALVANDRNAARAEAMSRIATLADAYATSWWANNAERRDWGACATECRRTAAENGATDTRWMSDVLDEHALGPLDPNLAFWSDLVHLVARHDGQELPAPTRCLLNSLDRAATAHLRDAS